MHSFGHVLRHDATPFSGSFIEVELLAKLPIEHPFWDEPTQPAQGLSSAHRIALTWARRLHGCANGLSHGASLVPMSRLLRNGLIHTLLLLRVNAKWGTNRFPIGLDPGFGEGWFD